MEYARVYSIVESEERDLDEVMEAVRDCLEEQGGEYGISGVAVKAVSRSDSEEYNE